ncbi:catechol O-methyltransferase A [Ornithorhynchus anatinus]|uniref:catechol O-methyltransferase A n=1 Tax=Ornithorhynchus anatinus TaxID=9258 RepID=UPI000454372A|nr:catechol O-methyltransferase A [Ornithorhynchus anatinus]XP_007663242.1 catechol O-methyltransferase A [Ornithorhynchus anatinus]
MLGTIGAVLGVLGATLLVLRYLVDHHRVWALLWHVQFSEWLRDQLSGLSRPQRILHHVHRSATLGDPQSVIAAVDNYCRHVEWAMNVGDKKGLILDKVVVETKPRIVLELGTYCGYSAIRIGRLLGPEARLITMEVNPAYATVAKKMITFAGLEGKIEVMVGFTSDLIPQLKEKCGLDTLDLVFLDHWKEQYLPDTKLLEECRLLREGSVLLADNVICPGAPEYLAYIRSNSQYRSQFFPSTLEYVQVADGMEKSVFLG